MFNEGNPTTTQKFVLVKTMIKNISKGLVINYGEGGSNSAGRTTEVLPLQKKVLVMRKGGGGAKSFGVILTQELEVLAILKGGR